MIEQGIHGGGTDPPLPGRPPGSGSADGSASPWSTRRFLTLLLPALLVLTGLLAAVHFREYQTRIRALEGEQARALETAVMVVSSDLKAAVSDLLALTASRGLDGLFDEGTQEAEAAFQQELSSFMATKNVYDQVRILGVAGDELIRINTVGGIPTVVPTDELQPKGDRYYFRHSVSLPPDGLYISRFDLNMEQGRIEEPWKPTIRLSVPLYGEVGEPARGVMVLNYLGASVLGALERAGQTIHGSPYMVNPEGYWLLGPDHAQEWGFMREGGEVSTLEASFPGGWAQLLQNETGQLRVKEGLLTFSTLRPLRDLSGVRSIRVGAAGGAELLPPETYHWIVLSHVSPEEFRALYLQSAAPYGVVLAILLPVLVLLSGLGAYGMGARRIAQKRIRLQAGALEVASNGIVITDLHGTILWVNAAFTALTGYTSQEISGANTRVLGSGTHSAEFFRELWDTIGAGRVWEGNLLNRRKDGTVFHEEMSINPLRDDEGEITHYIAIKKDISERKELEDRVRGAKEEAEKAHSLKSTFLSSISHEVRTPLNAILGFSQLLSRDQALSGSQRDDVQTILENGQHLLGLFDMIIEMSKVEAGEIELNQTVSELPEVMTRLANGFRAAAEAKDLSFHVQLSETLPRYVVVDGEKLKQILDGLLDNAVRFTEAGHVTLRVETEEGDGPKVMFSAEVEDSGRGIGEGDLDTIFEPFAQLDRLESSREGAGLGLAVGQAFARAMGGELSMTSKIGSGSTFRLKVPLTVGQQPPQVPGGFAESDESTSEERGPHDSPALTPESVASIPAELAVRIKDAAEAIDVDELEALALEVKDLDPAVAEVMGRLAEGFEFEALVELFDASGAGDNRDRSDPTP